ncbi:MAG: hypothetical protein R6V05_10095 [Candidatus Brocadiia bacterium]
MSALKCPGQDPQFMRATDVAEAPCPSCGHLVEFWPDEVMRKCRGCGQRVANPENTLKCLAWCEHAAECMEAMMDRSEGALAPLREELLERVEGVFGADSKEAQRSREVLMLAERIGQRVGANPLVLIPAAILHEFGGRGPTGGPDAARRRDGRLTARGVLSGLGVPPGVVEDVVDLLEGETGEGDQPPSPAGAALHDAVLIVRLAECGECDDPARTLPEQFLTGPGRSIGAETLDSSTVGSGE